MVINKLKNNYDFLFLFQIFIIPLYINLKNNYMLRKIKDAEIPCMDSEHNPPMHIVLAPGTYEHTCPSCGKKVKFTVPLITC